MMYPASSTGDSADLSHAADCKFPDSDTFICSGCGGRALWCCGCGYANENNPSLELCLECGQEKIAEEEERQREADAELERQMQEVEDAVNSLIAALAQRGLEAKVVDRSSLSFSTYIEAGYQRIRVSDHPISPFSPGFWGKDGLPLHPESNFTLIVPPEDGEIEELAERVVEAQRRDEAEEEG